MVVEGDIRGANQGCGDGVTKEKGQDAVLGGIGVVFVEGKENQGIGGERGVGEEGSEKVTGPGAGCCYRGVMTVRGFGRDC